MSATRLRTNAAGGGFPRKYRNQPTFVDGIRFASKKEAYRYRELKILESNNLISNLSLQPRFPLIVNGTKVATYVGDFAYVDDRGKIVEDVKGIRTPVYKLKKKLLKAIHGIDIVEV